MDLASLAPLETDLSSLKPFWPSSYGRPVANLVESIKETGLLHPLLALKYDGNLLLLSGNRRREALLQLGRRQAPVLIPPAETTIEDALTLALADNMDRGWNQAEVALIWNFLNHQFEPAVALRLSFYLGLNKSPKLRQWSLQASELPEEALTALVDGRLDLETGARLAQWSPPDRDAVWQLFKKVNPSKQKKKQWMDWLEDVERREGCSPAAILNTPEITTSLAEAENSGKSAAEEEARRYLWARRHPLLNQLHNRRRDIVRNLNLPSSIRLELDPTFEDIKFSLGLTFATMNDFQNLADILTGLQQRDDFKKLLCNDDI